jgi:hypothetical protein
MRAERLHPHACYRCLLRVLLPWSPGPAALPDRSARGIDLVRSLLVLTCSGRKERGGRPPRPADAPAWPQDLRDARLRVLASAQADTAHLLPAWRRYTGTFYQHARPALADAVAAGHVVAEPAAVARLCPAADRDTPEDNARSSASSIAATIGGAAHRVIPAKQTLTMGRLYAAMTAGAVTRALHRCHHA